MDDEKIKKAFDKLIENDPHQLELSSYTIAARLMKDNKDLRCLGHNEVIDVIKVYRFEG